jgi:hypothetical protein
MRYRSFMLTALAISVASPLQAQLVNTGGAGWTVTRNSVSGNFGSASTPAAAAEVPATTPPSVWQPNSAETKWISAWPTFSSGAGGNSYVISGDGNARWRYLFRYDFGGPVAAGTFSFNMGWDNILKSFQFSNGSALTDVAALNVNRPASQNQDADAAFGFCRSGDGIFPSGNTVCNTGFEVEAAAGAEWMQFELWGDGITDGMWLEWNQTPDPSIQVPEPSSMLLVGTGLFAMVAYRRRRGARRA